MDDIVLRYNEICKQIKEAKAKNSIVRLIAVSKTFGESKIIPLLEAGHKIFGENKVQEAHKKWTNLKNIYENVNLHLIGPLQSNKVTQALEIFDCIQTLDREKIAKKISSSLENNEKFKKKKIEFMIQVNIGNEEQKSGINLNVLEEFNKFCKFDLKLNVIGLMCIPPFSELPDEYFKILKNLCIKNNIEYCSMGMSNDYLKAVEYGTSYVRIGTGIFGSRS